MGTSGILLQETKNAFKIITKDNKLKSKYRRELCRDVFESILLKVSSRNVESVGLIESPGGGGVLPYISHIGMCRPTGWGLGAFLV